MLSRIIKNHVPSIGVAEGVVLEEDEALIAKSDIVETDIVQQLEPLQIHATLQIVIPTPNESMHLMHKSLVGVQQILRTQTDQLETILHNVTEGIESIDSLQILYDIRATLNKRIRLQSTEVSFMKVTDMAQNLSVSKSFLEKNMDGIFIEGKHFSRADDARLVRWNVERMHKWARGEEIDETDKQLLSKLLD